MASPDESHGDDTLVVYAYQLHVSAVCLETRPDAPQALFYLLL